MEPVVDGLYSEYGQEVHFAVLDADDAAFSEQTKEYGIQFVPTFVLVDSSGEEVNRFVGAVDESTLAAEIEVLE
jgi:thioredoxin-like negative regulator of GroEL